uniref:Putative ribonuclease H-like domain-containing protein n=1 Tax=Tanacetum cinerariifolium TaxID=118510 RepID=A0A6L2JBL0_TANCI|nr:putative ribonuclease H-like domain-containing protein [Tanacetum cinerariifolium]
MWKLRIEQYFQVQDYALWDVIENGNSFKPVPKITENADGTSTLTISGLVTAEEKAQKKNDVKSRSMLLMALPNEHLLTFSQYKDAKTLFEAIQARFDDIETMSFDDLYNNFKIVEQEVKRTVVSSSSSGSLNMAFLSSPSSTNEVNTGSIQVSVASTLVSTVSSPNNTANLSDSTVYAFLANQPNGSQLAHEDLEKIHEDDLEEMDLKWSLRNQESRPRNQDSSRKTVIVEDTSSKAIMAIDGVGFDWSYLDDDEVPTNMTLMAFSDLEIVVLKTDASFKESDIIALNLQLEKLKKEKESNQIKIDNFENGSKTLDKLIGSLFAPPTIDLSSSSLEEFKQPEFKRSFSHLIKDCDFHDKKMVLKPVLKTIEKKTGQREVRLVWNHAMRVNHQKFSNSRRNFGPTVGLTKSGIVPISTARQSSSRVATPVNTARPINTVAPKPIVNVAKSRQNAFQKTHSLSRRPFHKQTALKNRYLVNTTKVKSVNTVYTAKGKSVTSAVGKQGSNTVKSSTCWKADSGNKSFLSYYQEYNGGFVAFAGSSKGGKITGKGKIKTGKLDFEDVYFVKELKFNPFSVSQMCDKKNSVLFTETECLILSLDFKLPDENQVLLKNRVLVSKPHNKTPYELLIGRSPIISFMRSFGCPVTILNTLDHLRKFDGKADEGFLVGYSLNSKAFRVYNSRTKKVEENLHVNFIENKPNVVGSGPEWLFDIDSLTNLMNYQPVSIGNRTNGIAGFKIHSDVGQERKEKVFDQEYIFLPVLNTSSDVPSSNKEVESSPKDDAGAKSIVEPTCAKGGKIDDLGCLVPQMNSTNDSENTNSTNSFNTASPTVNTASDKDGTFQITYGEWNFSTPVPVNAVGSSFSHPAALDDFSKMPNLKDTGNFNDAYDDRDEGYRNKRDQRGIVIRNKSTLVAQGHRQEEGIDYDEVFALVARIEAIRLFLAYASFMDFTVYQMDVKSAFLYGTIKEEGHPTLGLWYPKDSPLELIAYSDSDYAGASLDRKSTTGGCQFLVSRLISWQCKKKTIVANSTTKAEYINASSCYEQVIWLQNQLLDYGYNFMQAKIHVDNESAIYVVKNPIYHSKTKHIEIRNHFIRDSYEKRLIEMHWFALSLEHGLRGGIELKGYFLNDGYADLVQHTDKKELAIPGQTEIEPFSSVNNSMANLKFVDQHNMVAYLEKSDDNTEFYQIVDFLSSCAITYALTVSPTIYASYIEQFWNTVSSKIVNSIKQIHAVVDGKDVVISESLVRINLLFDDEDGITCLTNDEIFENLALMGYEPLSTKLTFQKDEAVNQKEGDRVERAITTDASLEAAQDSGRPRSQETMGGTSSQTRSERVLEHPNEQPLTEGHTSGSGEGRLDENIELADNVPTPHDSLLTGGYTPGSDEGRITLAELMETYKILSNRVTQLETKLSTTKAVYNKAVITLTNRVKKLESQLKQERSKAVIHSLDKEGPSVHIEDSPKQGRIIEEMNKDENIKLQRIREIIQETELPKKLKKKEMIQLSLDEELAQKLYAKELAKEEARQEQERYNLEKTLELQRHLDQRKESNQGGYKQSYFKGMKYEDIRPLFERIWVQVHTFVPKDSKIDREVMKKAGFDLQIYKMRDVIPFAKIPWKSVSLNVQRKTNAKFLSDTRGNHNHISSSKGMLMHRCECVLIEFVMITITLNEDIRFHYMDSSKTLETSSRNVNTLSYVTPPIPKSSSFFADYEMDNANLKPEDGEEPLEIRLIRKWISYGKRGECCFIFISQNGDAIQSVVTLSVKSYFNSLFKVGSCYRLANYIYESGKPFMISAPQNTCIRLRKATKFQEIPDDGFPIYYFRVQIHQLQSIIS